MLVLSLCVAWASEGKGAATPAPSNSPAAPAPTPAEDNGFTVLCYHRFVARPETVKGPLSVYRLPLEEFRWQMQYLKDHGITPISLDQLKAYWFDRKPLPDKAVLLTFDDGFRSIYEKAFPVIRKYGYPGVLFCYTDFIRSQSDSLRYPEIEELQKYGIVPESHTKSHLNLGLEEEKNGTETFAKILAEELGDPITFLREKFNRSSKVLAYPYGVYNPTILKATEKAGYELAFSVNPGPNDRTLPPLILRRNLVLYPTKREEFAKIFKEKVLHLDHVKPGDGDVIDSQLPLIRMELLDDVDPTSIRFQVGNRTVMGGYNPSTHVFHHQVKAALKAGGHMLTIEAKDRKGQRRVFTWYFRIKHRHLGKEEESDLPTIKH